MTQSETGRRMTDENGRPAPISGEAVRHGEMSAMMKIREGLLRCPEVLEWLKERGIDPSSD